MKALYAAIAALLVAGNVFGQNAVPEKVITISNFAIGDNIAKYKDRVSERKSPLDTMHFGVPYDYTAKDIKEVLGYPIRFITMEFCSGQLTGAHFFFENITVDQAEQMQKQIAEWLGKPNSIGNIQSALNSATPMEQKSWDWGNSDAALGYGYFIQGSGNTVAPSLFLKGGKLTGQCMAREKSLSIQKQP